VAQTAGPLAPRLDGAYLSFYLFGCGSLTSHQRAMFGIRGIVDVGEVLEPVPLVERRRTLRLKREELIPNRVVGIEVAAIVPIAVLSVQRP